MSGLTCQELVELVTAYLDGALPAVERQRFERHLDSCRGCRAYLAQFEGVIALTGKLVPDNVEPGAREVLLTHFRHWHASPS